ncbi:actin [Gregarina niphandrodes]|uniref:Actin n=1 Tax=Gregarina niphandrodes TaxID=110365 RepID=A0A023BDV7_GRENI|nr:actin [Gregarina niphandrodes]EZG89686.1 actin [Gregarina niphandrodes]|eukprot:XP_011128460.1 actin [Gregarina niphandrodes]
MLPPTGTAPTYPIKNPNIYVLDVGAANTYWGFAGEDLPNQKWRSCWCYDMARKRWDESASEFWSSRNACVPHALVSNVTSSALSEFDGLKPLTQNGVCQTSLRECLRAVDNFYLIKPPPIREARKVQSSSGQDSARTSAMAVEPEVAGAAAAAADTAMIEESEVLPNAGSSESEDWQLASEAASAEYKRQHLSLDGGQLFVTEPSDKRSVFSSVVAELAFEEFGVASYFSMRKAPLAAFALGRPTALVVEGGPSELRLTPVFEGYALQQNSHKYAVSADLLQLALAEIVGLWSDGHYLSTFNPWKTPIPMGSTPIGSAPVVGLESTINTRYLNMARRSVVEDMALHVMAVQDPSSVLVQSREEDEEEEDHAYELPDGKTLYIAKERVENLTEFIFRPEDSQLHKMLSGLVDAKLQGQLTKWTGLPQAVVNCAFGCDVEVVPPLLHNVVLSGGFCAMPGLVDRLGRDLASLKSCQVAGAIKDLSNLKLKVASLAPFEMPMTTWIGASMVGHLSSFDAYWISKTDFEECGISVLAKRLIF